MLINLKHSQNGRKRKSTLRTASHHAISRHAVLLGQHTVVQSTQYKHTPHRHKLTPTDGNQGSGLAAIALALHSPDFYLRGAATTGSQLSGAPDSSPRRLDGVVRRDRCGYTCHAHCPSTRARTSCRQGVRPLTCCCCPATPVARACPSTPRDAPHASAASLRGRCPL